MHLTLRIERLVSIEDIEKVRAIDRAVWNWDAVPIHQLYTASINGGLVLGAYVDDELVGFQYSFAGYKNGRVYLCSHMLGILPAYRNQGIGAKLKKVQRQLAQEMGYELIVWTYDPLESANAHLNLHKLRGIGVTYFENYYGELNDSLNRGLPTDRFRVEWWIQSPHVKEEKVMVWNPKEHEIVGETALDAEGFPVIMAERDIDFRLDTLYVPIPEQIQSMKAHKPELSLNWRYATRKWCEALFQEGFVAIDLLRIPQQRISYYVFQKREHLSLD